MDNFCETMFKDDEKADLHVDNDYDFNIKLLKASKNNFENSTIMKNRKKKKEIEAK